MEGGSGDKKPVERYVQEHVSEPGKVCLEVLICERRVDVLTRCHDRWSVRSHADDGRARRDLTDSEVERARVDPLSRAEGDQLARRDRQGSEDVWVECRVAAVAFLVFKLLERIMVPSIRRGSDDVVVDLGRALLAVRVVLAIDGLFLWRKTVQDGRR